MLRYALLLAFLASAFDINSSKMTVHVYKRGMFSFLADNHEIAAPVASGSYDAASKVVEVHVKAAALKVMDPQLSQETRAKVQAAMESEKVLDVSRYPSIDFRSTAIDGSGRNLKITGDLTLHGQTHPIVVQAQQLDSTHYTGTTTVRQTTFGITPIRVAGGTVSVQDDVKVEFQIALGS